MTGDVVDVDGQARVAKNVRSLQTFLCTGVALQIPTMGPLAQTPR